MTQELVNPNRKEIDGLRKLADFLDVHPEFGRVSVATTYRFVQDKAEMARCAKILGSCKKYATDSFFNVKKRFGSEDEFGGVELSVTGEREMVCERVVKETKVVPAQEERTILVPATPEKVVEVYEWVCPDSLLNGHARPAEVREPEPVMAGPDDRPF